MRVRVKWGALCVLCLTMSCRSDVELHAPLPEMEGAASILSAVRWGQELALHALPISSAGEPLYVALRGIDDPDATIELLVYQRSLEELRIPPGTVSLAAGRGRPLPDPESVFTTTLEGSSLGAWRQTNGMSEELSALRLPLACPSLSVSTIDVEVRGLFSFLSPIGGEMALAGTDQGAAYLVEATGLIPLAVTPTVSSFDASDLDDQGGLWVTSGDRVFSATVDPEARSLTLTEEYTASGRLAWLDMGGSGPDGFAMELTGKLFQLRGGVAELVWDLGLGPTFLGGVARISEGEAIAVHGQNRAVLRYRDERIREEPVFGSPVLTTAVFLPGLGERIADDSSKVFAPGDPAWKIEADAGGAHTISRIVPWKDGYAAAGLRPMLMLHGAEGKDCIYEDPDLGRSRLAAGLQDAILLLAHEPEHALRVAHLTEL